MVALGQFLQIEANLTPGFRSGVEYWFVYNYILNMEGDGWEGGGRWLLDVTVAEMNGAVVMLLFLKGGGGGRGVVCVCAFWCCCLFGHIFLFQCST